MGKAFAAPLLVTVLVLATLLAPVSAPAAVPGEPVGGLGAGFQNPRMPAVDDDGLLYVPSLSGSFPGGPGDVRVIAPSGMPVRTIGAGLLNSPEAVAARGGRIYVIGSGPEYLSMFDASGARIGGVSGTWYTDVDITVDGRVIAVASGDSRLDVFDANLNPLGTIGGAGSGEGQLTNPRSVSIDASGTIIVGDLGNSRIKLFSSAGDFIRDWPVVGPQGMDIASGPSGLVYVLAVDQVTAYRSDGTAAGSFTVSPLGGPAAQPAGIVVSAAGRILVSESSQRQIMAFSAEGLLLHRWIGNNNTWPMGSAIDANGDVLVTCIGTGEVRVFDRTGSLLRSWRPVVPPDITPTPVSLSPNLIAVHEGTVLLGGQYGVYKFDKFGTFLGLIGAVAAQGSEPTIFGVAVDGLGRIAATGGFVMTPANQLWTGTMDGPLTLLVEYPHEKGDTGNCDVDIDGLGQIYVSHEGYFHIKVFNFSGTLLRTLSTGEVPVPGFLPHGTAVDSAGNLYLGSAPPGLPMVVIVPPFGPATALPLQDAYSPYLLSVTGDGSRILAAGGGDPTVHVYQGFSAPALPPPQLFGPNGGESWAGGSMYGIAWSASPELGATVRLQLSREGHPGLVIDAAAANNGNYSWTIPTSLAPGSYRVWFSSNESLLGDGSDAVFTITQVGLDLMSPSGGEAWQAGTTAAIAWTPITRVGPAVRLELWEGEALSRVLASSTDNDGSWEWTIPIGLTPSDNYAVKVISTTDGTLSDMSGPFTIASAVAVTSPNGGEVWEAGSTRAITWDALAAVGPQIDIQLWRSGTIVRTLAAGLPNSGSWSWAIPLTEALGGGYAIRILSATNGSVRDASDEPFSIVAPTLTVTSPNGGETWEPGATRTITWTGTLIAGATVKIQLWRDGVLVRTIASGAPNTGSYSWTIPLSQTPGTTCRVKVMAAANAAIGDASNADFRIVPPVTVITPNGGETLWTGIASSLRWGTVSAMGAVVRIDLYKGGAFNRTIASAATNNGSFSWTVPASVPVGSDFRLWICSVANSTIGDGSDAMFSIQQPALTVTSPNGGETWEPGTTRTITWTGTLAPGAPVRVELWKNGALAKTLASNAPNTGSFVWPIPLAEPPGSVCRVKVASVSTPAIADASDANFTIPPPVEVTSPNGGEIWKPGTTRTITWESSPGFGATVLIQLWKGSVINRTIAYGAPNVGFYDWKVASSVPAGADYRVRVCSATNSAIKDSSDGVFAVTTAPVSGGEPLAWSAMESPVADVTLRAVWRSPEDRLFAVGTGGTILERTGGIWYQMPCPLPFDLLAVWGRSATEVYAVGANGSFLQFNGAVWIPLPPPGTMAPLRAVWGDTGGGVLVSAADGSVWRWSGGFWTVDLSPGPTAYFDATALWGTGAGEAYGVMTDQWLVSLQPSGASADIADLGGGAMITGLGGTGTSKLYGTRADGTVFRYDGTTWELLPGGIGVTLYGVCAGGATGEVVAVGESGAIVRALDPYAVTIPSSCALGCH